MAGANGMKRSAETVSSHSSPYCRVARYFRDPSMSTNMRMNQAMIPTGPISPAREQEQQQGNTHTTDHPRESGVCWKATDETSRNAPFSRQ